MQPAAAACFEGLTQFMCLHLLSMQAKPLIRLLESIHGGGRAQPLYVVRSDQRSVPF
jgi:hypothetical protein